MPSVPKYNNRPLQETGVSIDRVNPGAATGATDIAGFRRINNQAEKLGAGVFEAQKKAQSGADDLLVTEAIDKFKRRETDMLFNRKEGAFARQGKDSLGVADEYGEKYNTLSGEIENTLQNDRQKEAFRLWSTKRRSEFDRSLEKHTFSEMEKKQAAAIADQIKAVKEIAIASKNSNLNQAQKEYDFFISHASEDKEAIAEPLAKALINRGARVWYDKFTLAVGDSLRESIDYGLVHSTFGIVILSEVYFKKFWTGKELNGLFAKQEEGRKVILPLWHNVTKDIVKQKSPILADMLALKTADLTVEEIADSFYEFISSKTEVEQ